MSGRWRNDCFGAFDVANESLPVGYPPWLARVCEFFPTAKRALSEMRVIYAVVSGVDTFPRLGYGHVFREFFDEQDIGFVCAGRRFVARRLPVGQHHQRWCCGR
ncbi:hypothetical protein D3C86_1887310 [compost metagenome]